MLIQIEPLTDEWHAYRQGRITATDCSAILGADSFKSPAEVWARVTGKEMPNRETTPFMEWGNRTEQMHADWFVARHPDLTAEPWGGIEQHASLPWLCATPDYRLRNDFEVREENDPGGVLELKAPSQWTADEWKQGEVPLPYIIQVQMQFACSCSTWGHASALIQPDIFHAPIERDEKFIQAALDTLSDWWELYVVRDTPPPAHAATADKHAKMLRQLGASMDFKGTVQLSGSAVAAHEEILDLKAEIKALENKKDMLETRILAELQNATYGVIDGTSCYRFKTAQRNMKATEARVVEFPELRYLKNLPADCVL